MITADEIKLSQLNRLLNSQVTDIAREIAERKNDLNESGLLSGKAGITLLYAYLSKVFPGKEYSQTTFDLLDDLSNSLAEDELDVHLSTGVAGIAFTFQHLRNIGILDRDADLDLSELDEFISRGVDNDHTTANWDPLHGMTGLGIYFLERYKETGEKKYLEKIVGKLALLRTHYEKYMVWVTPGYGKWSTDNYNLGMAHGMPGVLSLLAQVHEKNIMQKEIGEMISSCLPFLLRQQYNDDEEYCFPTSVPVDPGDEKRNHGSRLAWCYGDLCMANALIHCGKALKRNDWKLKGIEIALKTTKRSFESSGCMDAPFCHGTTGLAHQYNRLYGLTGNDVFKYSTENWIQLTLKHFYKPGEGIGGYFFRSLNEEKDRFEYVPGYGLLEGSVGIALIYLSWLYNIKPDWDIVFLTNV